MLDNMVFEDDRYNIILDDGTEINNLQRSSLTFVYDGKIDKSIFTRNTNNIKVVRIITNEILKRREEEKEIFIKENPNDIWVEPYYVDEEVWESQSLVKYEYHEEENKTEICFNQIFTSELDNLISKLEYMTMMLDMDMDMDE